MTSQHLLNVFRRHHRCAFSAAEIIVPPTYIVAGFEFPLGLERGAPYEAVLVAKQQVNLYGAEHVEVRPRMLSSQDMFTEEEMSVVVHMLYDPTPHVILKMWYSAIVRGDRFTALARRYWHRRGQNHDTNDFARTLATKFARQGGLCAFSGVPMSLSERRGDRYRCEMAPNGVDLVCAAFNVDLVAHEAADYWDTCLDVDRRNNVTRNSMFLNQALMKWKRVCKRRKGS